MGLVMLVGESVEQKEGLGEGGVVGRGTQVCSQLQDKTQACDY